MKKKELKISGLKSIKGGSTWKVLNGGTPKVCPFCTSEHIANYSDDKWICATCGSIIE